MPSIGRVASRFGVAGCCGRTPTLEDPPPAPAPVPAMRGDYVKTRGEARRAEIGRAIVAAPIERLVRRLFFAPRG